jgi:hypothetical protein
MPELEHQSLKELAQRPDEEVVQLWLEQRGLSISPHKVAQTKGFCMDVADRVATARHKLKELQALMFANVSRFDSYAGTLAEYASRVETQLSDIEQSLRQEWADQT